MIIILKEKYYKLTNYLHKWNMALGLHLAGYQRAGEEKVKERSIVVNQQAYFYLEVWSLFHLLGLLLWGSLDLVFLLVSLQPPQLLLNTPTLLPHLFSVLLIEEGKLPSAATKTHSASCLTFTGSVVKMAWT